MQVSISSSGDELKGLDHAISPILDLDLVQWVSIMLRVCRLSKNLHPSIFGWLRRWWAGKDIKWAIGIISLPKYVHACVWTGHFSKSGTWNIQVRYSPKLILPPLSCFIPATNQYGKGISTYSLFSHSIKVYVPKTLGIIFISLERTIYTPTESGWDIIQD